MDNNTINNINKTSSGLGFMLFAATATMYTISYTLTKLLYNRLDTTSLLLLDIIISIVSLFLVGMFYCWFSNTGLGYVIKVKWVKLSLSVPLILIALAVSFTADYLTELLQSTFSIFGVENGVELSTKSSTLIENILNIIAVSIIPPLVEEFLFRGILLGKLRFFGDSFALFVSSALFAVMHGNIIQIPFAFIVGLVLAFITIKTNSIVPAIIVHFLVNFRSVLISITLENKFISDEMLNYIYLILLLAVFAAGIISAAILSRKKNFFKLESRDDIPFRQAVKASVISVGMLMFLITSLVNTIFTVSVSWFG